MSYWWEAKSDVQRGIWSTTEQIRADQEGLQARYRRYASFYFDRVVSGFDGDDWHREFDDDVIDDEWVTWNVVRSIVNTLVAKVTLHRPVPKFQTNAGSFDLQERARKAELFVKSELRQSDSYQAARRALKQACVFGTGVLKTHARRGKLAVECVHTANMLVDSIAASSGESMSMFHRDQEILKN